MSGAALIGGEAQESARMMYGMSALPEPEMPGERDLGGRISGGSGTKRMSGRIRTARHVADMPPSGGRGEGLEVGDVSAALVFNSQRQQTAPMQQVARCAFLRWRPLASCFPSWVSLASLLVSRDMGGCSMSRWNLLREFFFALCSHLCHCIVAFLT